MTGSANNYWQSMAEVVNPANAKDIRDMAMNLPAYGDSDICTLCAIASGVEWPLKEGAAFADRTCTGCGRHTPTTKVKNWTWK